MKRPSKITAGVLVALYVATWIGGAVVYRRDMARQARANYARALDFQRTFTAEQHRPFTAVFAGGPRTNLRWCVPIAPGLLLVSSEYEIGPAWVDDEVRLVVCYGIGTVELWGWGS